jgi:cytochrome c oxidase subunit 3/cytochrome o ubiquinol oxidase subunit 3
VSETGHTAAPPLAGTAAPHAAAPSLPLPPSVEASDRLGTARWGMIAFLLSEVSFFSTLIVTYLAFLGQDTSGPTPHEALSFRLVVITTACLLSSSLTIHLAEGALHKGQSSAFAGFWLLTIVLGAAFLAGTAYEWWELITVHGLKIGTNLFGTTFYTLVGFHGLHVSMGLVALTVILALALRGEITGRHAIATEMVSWYWHFVDVVWVAVFSVVYVFGR